MSADKNKKARRAREERSTQVETLLNALTVDQIRSVISRLSVDIPRGSRNAREGLINGLLEGGRSTNEILKTCYQVEAETPHKHFVVFKWNGGNTTKLPLKSFDSTICPHLKKLKIVHAASNVENVFLTLEHQVAVTEWVPVDKETKKRQQRSLRHPICLRLFQNENVAFFSYPGFSHGLGTKSEQRIAYHEMIADVLNALKSELAWTFEALPFRTALDLLTQLDNKRARRIKASPASKNGRLTVTTTTDGVSTEEWLASFVGARLKSGDVQALEQAIKEAFKNSSMDQMVLFWTEEAICTRIDFWASGCEFLFVWNRAGHSYEKCLNIFKTLLEVLRATNQNLSLPDVLKAVQPGEIIKPQDVINKFGGTEEVVRNILVTAVKAGFIVPVYRIKTENLIQNYENAWTTSLRSLAKIFEISDRESIDGSNPKNIEIAFERVVIEREVSRGK